MSICIHESSNIIKETLRAFKVDVDITNITVGNTNIQYDIRLVRISDIGKVRQLKTQAALQVALCDETALLEVNGRITLTTKNPQPTSVSMKNMWESQEFRESKSPLSFVVGKDIIGNTIIGDIETLTHALVVGTTGSGKSVGINGIITSILRKSNIDETRFLMFDVKKVELTPYNGIPHLLAPVITDVKKAVIALDWAVKEMENRYSLLEQRNVRKLAEYNSSVSDKSERLPRIVLIIDELANLMRHDKTRVEHLLSQILEKARAAGIYLIAATQRPSRDIISGQIVANFPSRIIFAVANQTDARVCGHKEAHMLLGKGDMYYYPTDLIRPVRVQGAFISNDDVEDIVNCVKVGKEQFNIELMASLSGTPEFDDDELQIIMSECKKSSEWKTPRKIWVDNDGKECSINEVFLRTKGFSVGRDSFTEKWV